MKQSIIFVLLVIGVSSVASDETEFKNSQGFAMSGSWVMTVHERLVTYVHQQCVRCADWLQH